MPLDQILYMQAQIAHRYCGEENLSPEEFLAIDTNTDVLEFIAAGYELFHLTGTEGIMNEVREFVNLVNNSPKR
ncbi:hypothetical protein FACS189443_7200 [Planctomycetales bacterium]|nr:hypothetical protein FACS189443_7200 [Planctomycetales bacterium]